MSKELMNLDTTYPGLQEIIPDLMLTRLPAALVDIIKERYIQKGAKYVTEHQTDDGRFINSCMFKSSIQDALEEVVDAVFNTLVWILKIRIDKNSIQDGEDATEILMGLVDIYSALAVARSREFQDA